MQQNLKAGFEAANAGVNKAGVTIVLGEGADYAPMQINNRDAQYLESRQFSKTEICAMFRVPPHMAGDLTRATFNNIEHQSLDFVVYSLGPWLERIEAVLNQSLLTDNDRKKGLFFQHNVRGLLRGDNTARANFYQSGIVAGWLTRNEAREMEGLNAIEGADELLVPLNMQAGGTDDIPGDAGKE
jgi:HK97 family phage portal protein